jgi:hypothetical protein
MGYRDRKIIRDKTGEIYNQGLSTITNMSIKYFTNRGERIRQDNLAIEKQRTDRKRSMNSMEIEQDEVIKATGDVIRGIDGGIETGFQGNTRILGQDALNARADRLTLDMTSEERAKNKLVSDKFNTYNTSMAELGGLFQSEITERYGNKEGGIRTGGFSIQNYGTEWDYVGDNVTERLTSQFSLSALDNTPANIYDGKMTKTTNYNDKGVGDATISTLIPTDNAKFLEDNPEFARMAMNDEDWEKHKKDNGIIEKDGKFVFEKTYTKKNFGEGFTRKTMAAPDAKAIFEDTSTTTEKGIPDSAFLTDQFNSFRRSGQNDGVEQESRQRYVNPDHFIGKTSPSWVVAQSAAKGVLTASIKDINQYITGRLDVSDVEEMKTDGVYDPTKIAEAIQERLAKTALSQMTLVSHINADGKKVDGANAADVAYYKEQGVEIEIGDSIYYKGTAPKDVSESTTTTTTSADELLAQELQTEVSNLTVFGDEQENINADTKWLEGKGLKILKKVDAVSSIKIQVDKNANIDDPRLKVTDSDGRVYDEVYLAEISDSKDKIFLSSNGKTTFLPSYDPNNKSSMLTILDKYGKLSQKTRTINQLNASQRANKAANKTAHDAYMAAGGTLSPKAWEAKGKPKK